MDRSALWTTVERTWRQRAATAVATTKPTGTPPLVEVAAAGVAVSVSGAAKGWTAPEVPSPNGPAVPAPPIWPTRSAGCDAGNGIFARRPPTDKTRGGRRRATARVYRCWETAAAAAVDAAVDAAAAVGDAADWTGTWERIS